MQHKHLSGRALLAVSAVLALAACANTTTTASNDASTDPTRLAGASAADSHTVSDVSDAVGQRLDTMLSARPSGTTATR